MIKVSCWLKQRLSPKKWLRILIANRVFRTVFVLNVLVLFGLNNALIKEDLFEGYRSLPQNALHNGKGGNDENLNLS